jgi:TRAP-type C4-dicarboxylate transport system substrate-binding protein
MKQMTAAGASVGGVRVLTRVRSAAIGAVCAVFAFTAMAGPALARNSNAKKIKYQQVSLKISDDFPTTGQPLNLEFQRWATQTIENASHGAIKFSFYPNAELYTGATAATALSNGTLDMAAISTPTIVGLIPQFNILSLPFLGPSVQKSVALTEPGLPLFDSLATLAAKQHITMLPVGTFVPGELGIITQSSTPIGLSGVGGLKVRTVGGAIDDGIVQRLGGSPVDMTPTDVPTAMQTGALNAAKGSAAFLSGPLAGIAHGFLDTGAMYSTGYMFFASSAIWSKLSLNDRNLIDSTLQKLFKQWNGGEFSLTNREIFAQLEAKGVWIKGLTKAEVATAQSKLRPVWAGFGTASGDATVYKALEKTRKKDGLPPTL